MNGIGFALILLCVALSVAAMIVSDKLDAQ
jgi:hypothetical protein